MLRNLLAVLLLAFSVCASVTRAASFVVTNNTDTAGITCATNCSLRQAITAANASSGADIILGYSQRLSVANTSATLSNAQIMLVLNGAGIAAGVNGFNFGSGADVRI
jgi:hypothetical protein